jgi:hypothetical protein
MGSKWALKWGLAPMANLCRIYTDITQFVTDFSKESMFSVCILRVVKWATILGISWKPLKLANFV